MSTTILLAHTSLRLPLSHPQPTNDSGSATQWRSQTPAMAAGLSDHVWTLREVLLFLGHYAYYGITGNEHR